MANRSLSPIGRSTLLLIICPLLLTLTTYTPNTMAQTVPTKTPPKVASTSPATAQPSFATKLDSLSSYINKGFDHLASGQLNLSSALQSDQTMTKKTLDNLKIDHVLLKYDVKDFFSILQHEQQQSIEVVKYNLQVAFEALKLEFDSLVTEYRQLKSDQKSEHEELKAQLTNVTVDNAVLKSQLTKVNGDNAIVKTQLTQVNSQLTKVNGDNAIVKAQLTKVNGDNTLLKSQLSSVTADIAGVKSQLKLGLDNINNENKQTHTVLANIHNTMLKTASADLVAFCVGRSSSFKPSSTARIPMDVEKYNVGGYFHRSDDSFHAPFRGVYTFFVSAEGNGAPSSMDLYIYTKKTGQSKIAVARAAESFPKSGYGTVAVSVIVQMEKGETASVWVAGSTYSVSTTATLFWGKLDKKL